ncbi:MAG TPA: substrate-binding domain-containing protein [Pseudonocardiaceae bacterium]|jgi:Ca-activated chloride channel family protein
MRARLAFAVLVLVGVLVAACTGGPPPGPSPTTSFSGPAYTLRVLGGSELADMQPILDEAAKATGVTVKLTQTGTLSGAQTVASGNANGVYDATWFSSNNYLGVQPGADNEIGATTNIMYSPVLLGLRRDIAARLGWDKHSPSWADIAAAAGAHRFTFGMTNPADSNSGFSALVGIAEAVANTGAALTTGDIDKVSPQLREFFDAQTLSSGSSGWLSQAFAGAASRIDGMVNYESLLLSYNAAHRSDPLTLVYPSDGVLISEYPLTLLSSASSAAKSAYNRLVGYLQTPDVQREIMTTTHRRPVPASIKLSPELAGHTLYQLPFPATSDVVNGLIAAYFDTLRRPARTVYVLDTSGSMKGDRIAGLKSALAALSGANPSLAGQFDQFHEREQVTILPFNTAPGAPTTFDVPQQNPQPVLDQIAAYGNGLTAGGDTAIYDSLVDAYTIIGQQAATDPDRINSIVLLTDGENNTGRNFAAFSTWYHQLSPGAAAVPVFPILFGEGNVAEMKNLATLTGGLAFDARTQSLTQVFAQIRGYQ